MPNQVFIQTWKRGFLLNNKESIEKAVRSRWNREKVRDESQAYMCLMCGKTKTDSRTRNSSMNRIDRVYSIHGKAIVLIEG